MHKIQRLLLNVVIFLVLTFGILIPLYVHYTAVRYTGAYDTLYLSEYSPYDTILLEVHAQEGVEPYNSSLAVLGDRVRQYTGKEVIVATFHDIGNDEIPPVIKDYDVTRLGNKIIKNHTQYHTDWFTGRIVIYIIYTGAKWSGETKSSAAGVTYNANSMMVFKEIIPDAETETAILIHETGHLWGLEHSNNSNDIMNVHLDEYIISHLFDGLPNDFSEKEKKLLGEKHNSRFIFPIKPYEPLYSVVLNLVNTMVSP